MTTLNTSRSAQIHHEVRNQDIEYIMKCALLDVFNVDIQDTNLASNNKKIKKNWKRKWIDKNNPVDDRIFSHTLGENQNYVYIILFYDGNDILQLLHGQLWFFNLDTQYVSPWFLYWHVQLKMVSIHCCQYKWSNCKFLIIIPQLLNYKKILFIILFKLFLIGQMDSLKR